MERAPTVSEIIDRRPMSRYQFWTMALCGMVIVLDGFDTQSIGFLAPSMAETLHVPVKTFGPVFAAALVGLMISSMLSGPIADRWGQKGPIVTCTLIFGLFAVLTARCTSFNQLLAFRFLTGLGLGGALSNSVALMSEYAPKRLLAVIVSMMFCGMPAGAVLATLVSPTMLPRATVKEQSSTARRPPKALTRCCTSRMYGVVLEMAPCVCVSAVGEPRGASLAMVCLLTLR